MKVRVNNSEHVELVNILSANSELKPEQPDNSSCKKASGKKTSTGYTVLEVDEQQALNLPNDVMVLSQDGQPLCSMKAYRQLQ